ncbi:MAG: C25 family cysteine peptidase [Bacteroidales bacterium]
MKLSNPSIKALLLLLVTGVFLSGVYAQKYTYSDSYGKQGFQLTQQKSNSVEVVYSINTFAFSKEQINNEELDVIELPGTFLLNNEGAPNLPGQGRFLAIPEGASANVAIISMQTETFQGIEMAPAPRIPWETETGPLDYIKNNAIYSKDAFYPANPVSLSEITEIRGVDAVMLGITPFQYNPVTKELIVYRDLRVNIEFVGGNGHVGDDRLRSRWWDPLMADMFLNYESLPEMDYNKSFQSAKDVGCEYLIITPTNPEFQQWADSIKKFRNMQGIMTDIMTVEDCGGNNVNVLENFFNNAFDTWDIVPSAVLLMGDYGTNPANSIISPIWDSYCASDNIFADVNNNDMPDIVFARMTAQNETHLETMVTKILNYERTPPTSADFYQNPISALGFQTERWFQICSEAVAGFWEVELGKTANRINAIYSGTPGSTWSTATNTSTVLNLFGPNGLGYIPGTPGEVNCSWYGSAGDVVNGINAGAFMLQHRDHGFEQGWGEPAFQSSNINSLNNTDLTFIWSVNCLTGKYNMSGECFAEKFHRHKSGGENSGCVGINAASEVSYSFVNDTYVWGAYDNMWPQFLPEYGSTPAERGILPAFGNAAGKYFLQQSNWPYNTNNKEVTYNLFHHHGDAFQTVYSEVPQNLTVNHNPILYAGVSSFEITANEGAFIALTVNGEIIGTAEATGGPLSITIPAQQPPHELVVTITLQNYYRYSNVVDIIPASGPYIVYSAVEMFDASGNGNGLMETSETILASLSLENVGIELAENVAATISTTDPFVTITDASEEYGNIAAGSTAVMDQGFSWVVADNIPDMHQVVFELNATDGSDSWITSFTAVAHAPKLEIGSLTIEDSQGNGNGKLDPGETVDLIINTYNNGSYLAALPAGNLFLPSSDITLNNSTFEFNEIAPGTMAEAVFNITVDANAVIGSGIGMIYAITSGGYDEIKNFNAGIGSIAEDWELGNMTQYEWQTGGDNTWSVVNSGAYEGTYCAKSGAIGNVSSTWLEIEYEVSSDDVISFWYKVSSESSYDFLTFYIDGNSQGSWSGEVGWSEAQYPVTAGNHIFTWKYEKDYSVSNGSDCAWVDYIEMPPPPSTFAFAGLDRGICETSSFETQGMAYVYDVVNWASSGTGSFDDTQNISAIYTPSQEDIENGSVTLSLTAYGPEINVSDDMILTIYSMPTVMAGSDALSCSNTDFELAEASVENTAYVVWMTSGDGSFNDATQVNANYTPGTTDLLNGNVTLTLYAYPMGDCDHEMDEIVLTFTDAPEAFAGIETYLCSDTQMSLTESMAENYTTLEWSTTGDGMFDDYTTLHPVYSFGTGDIATGSALLTLTAHGNGNCTDAISEVIIIIEAAPEVFAGNDDEVNSDESYTIESASVSNYATILWTTSGDGSFDNDGIMNPIYTPGIMDIDNEMVTLTLTAEGIGPCGEISDDMELSINTVGIGENTAGYRVGIFPNPNSGMFTLEMNGGKNVMSNIYMYNSLGEIVFAKENITIQGSRTEKINLELKEGIYYLRIEGDEMLINRKVIIKK